MTRGTIRQLELLGIGAGAALLVIHADSSTERVWSSLEPVDRTGPPPPKSSSPLRARLRQLRWREPLQVYNLEIHGAHSFQTTHTGIASHNMSSTPELRWPQKV